MELLTTGYLFFIGHESDDKSRRFRPCRIASICVCGYTPEIICALIFCFEDSEGLSLYLTAYTDMIGARSEQYNLAGFDQTFWSIIEVETDSDAEGIKSSSLRSILEQWPAEKPKPKLLYTVVVGYSIHSLTSEMLKIEYGCNPTGMTATLRRREAVLQLTREHDFIILEGTYPFKFFIPSRIVNLTI